MTGPLRPIELATAAVLGAVTVVLVLAGFFIPHASAITALGVVPMAVVTHRHRPRATVAATVASATVSFLVAGTGPISAVVLCALVGGVAGHAHRRGWGYARVAAAALVVGPSLAAAYIGLLFALASLRHLILVNIRNEAKGIARVLSQVPSLRPLGHRLDHLVGRLVADWWQLLGVAVVAFVVFAVILTYRWIGPLLAALDRMVATDRLAPAADAPGVAGPAAPVPVTLDAVTVHYPGAESAAVDDVSLHVAPATLTAVVGANGSGKSTLSRLLAGCPPTAGQVLRPGPAGLGRRGGVALVSQRPESQVLGVRAADDVVWGLPPDAEVDVDGLLASVGLAGMAGRETSTLSGGELQRLALAAALARHPRLLVADEVTAMVDAAGRHALVDLLAGLPERTGTAVVTVTHRPVEAERATQVIRLDGGRRVVGGGWPEPPDAPPDPGLPTTGLPATGLPATGLPATGAPRTGAPPAGGVLRFEGVSHRYAAGTPWEQTALSEVDLTIGEGEGVLVVGDNGSGKSTLAWIAAGLLRPSAGRCLLRGEPVPARAGAVALAFQHARLQVQKTTVGREVCAAGGVERDAAEAALHRTGLDGPAWWDRSVDQLSGGQLRRVALAGLLASRPAVLVLDEPLAGLDAAGRADVLAALGRLRAEQGTTLVVITHDLEGLHAVGDRCVRLSAGRVVADEPLALRGRWA